MLRARFVHQILYTKDIQVMSHELAEAGAPDGLYASDTLLRPSYSIMALRYNRFLERAHT